jgi:hypothetical protein
MAKGFNRTTYLATSGDRPVKAAGEQVWAAHGLNVYTGELVVFNPKTNLTVAAADILNQERVSIAVGVGAKGQIAKSLRYLAGESFDLCSAKISADVSRPKCATPQVQDVFFDCTKCDENYTFTIGLDDSLVRSRFNVNERSMYAYTVATECGGCDDCETDVPCVQVRNSIVDQINQKYTDDPTKLVYFQRRSTENQYQPFRALPLYNAANTLKEYCFSLADSECKNCSLIEDGIGGISINGEVTNFTGTTSGADTLPGQMELVIKQLNAALEAAGVGYAHLTKGLHDCCSYCIQLSSSATILLRDSAGETIAPSTQSNPFSTAETSLTCGFRVIADPVTVECLCDWPSNLPVPNYYGRTVEVQPVLNSGWVKDNFFVYDAASQALPEGFGFFYQDQERYQHNGGPGRNYRYSNRRVGVIGLPDKHSRDSNTTVDCSEVYCVYNILSQATNTLRFNNAFSVTNTDASWVLVPASDTTTRTSWETVLSELNKNGLCITSEVTCAEPD